MNNRLHKLTDKEASLNYYSRHRGKPHHSRHSRHSPLIPPHTPTPSLLTSRTRPLTTSRMTDSPRSPEILIMEEQEQSRQNGQILIVEDQEQVESVYQHEQEEPVEFYKSEVREEQQSEQRERLEEWKEEDCYEQRQAQLEEYRAISPERKKDERSESSPSPSKESPIYILEEDQNLIWIQKEEGHSGSKSNSIKIQTDSDSSQQENQNQSQQKEQFFSNLPNIMELSSIEQQDVEESFHSMTTSRIPVSPQTAPFIRLHPVQQNLRPETQPDEQQKQNNKESLTWWPGGSSPRRSVAIAIQDEQSESESNQQQLQKQHAYPSTPANCLLDSDQLSEVFSLEESKPLSQSTLKTLDLIDSISPRKINSVVGMQQLIEQQAQKYHRIIKDQQGTIAIYRTLLEIRLKVPQIIVKKQQQRLGVDEQITTNQHILRCLALFKDKKTEMRIL